MSHRTPAHLLLAVAVIRELGNPCCNPGRLGRGSRAGRVRPGASGSGIGVALILAAVTACALYTVLARRLLLDDASVAVTLVQQAAALGFAVLIVTVLQAVSGEGLDVASLTPSPLLHPGCCTTGSPPGST